MGTTSSTGKYHPDEGNGEIEYNVKTGLYTIKDNYMYGMLNFGKHYMYEKDMSIMAINEIRMRANLSTLTNSDIDMLYYYSQNHFKTPYSRQDFENQPLKNLFPNLDDSKLLVNHLMPAASDYKKGHIEHFNDSKYDYWSYRICLILAIILFAVSVSYYVSNSFPLQ